MEFRTCKECGTTKELVRENFRFTSNHFKWTCRVCQNAHKKKMYHLKKARKPKMYDHKKVLRKIRVQAMIEKYDRVLKTLNSAGVSVNAPSEFVDSVLDGVAVKLNSRSA
jgi:hypothetical protein